MYVWSVASATSMAELMDWNKFICYLGKLAGISLAKVKLFDVLFWVWAWVENLQIVLSACLIYFVFMITFIDIILLFLAYWASVKILQKLYIIISNINIRCWIIYNLDYFVSSIIAWLGVFVSSVIEGLAQFRMICSSSQIGISIFSIWPRICDGFSVLSRFFRFGFILIYQTHPI